MSEEWVSIPQYEDYKISTEGRVISYKNKKQPRFLKLQPNPNGYLYVTLLNGKQKTLSVHKLVALSFLGEKPTGHAICHNDGNKTNNSLENLRYDSYKNNELDKIQHGTHRISVDAMRKSNRKITRDQILEMVHLYKNTDLSQKDLGKYFNVKASTISSIFRGVSWPGLLTQDQINELKILGLERQRKGTKSNNNILEVN